MQDVRRRGRRGAARADRGRGGVLTAPFTRAGFEALLEGALEAGYTFAPFDQVPDVAQVCLLRHDVDADLGAAVEFARIEQRVLGGSLRVGRRCWLGPATVFRDGLEIGDDAYVGLGALVFKDVESGERVMGSPAREIEAYKEQLRLLRRLVIEP